MEKSLKGVIPVNTSKVAFLTASLARQTALGVGHSVYVANMDTGENIARINHFPHLATCAAWSPQGFELVTADSGGFILLSDLSTMVMQQFYVLPCIVALEFHYTQAYLFVMNHEKILVWQSHAKKPLCEIEVKGFKMIPDLFAPQKLVVIDDKSVSVIRNFNTNPKVHQGNVSDVKDAVINPGTANSIYLLTKGELLIYDTVFFM